MVTRAQVGIRVCRPGLPVPDRGSVISSLSIPRPLRCAALLLSLALAAGCEPAPDAPASVTLRYREVQPLTRDRLVVTVDDQHSNWYFEGVDFEPTDDGWLVSRSLKLSAKAGVRIAVTMRSVSDSTDRAVAAGQIMLPNSPNERWQVDIFASELEPTVACGSCSFLARFPIVEGSRPAARDWLYIRSTGKGTSPTGPR